MLGKQFEPCLCTWRKSHVHVTDQESYEFYLAPVCFVTCMGLPQEICLAAKAGDGPLLCFVPISSSADGEKAGKCPW